MSANRFKIGDKVKVCKNLIEGRQYGCIYCSTDMAGLGLSDKTFTISVVDANTYQLEGYNFWWTDEMLEPAEKTLDNLCAGDFIKDGNKTRMILATLDGCYLVSSVGDYIHAGCWYTANDLRDFDYVPVNPDIPEPTIEIDGKRYDEAEVKKSIKDLKPIE